MGYVTPHKTKQRTSTFQRAEERDIYYDNGGARNDKGRVTGDKETQARSKWPGSTCKHHWHRISREKVTPGSY